MPRPSFFFRPLIAIAFLFLLAATGRADPQIVCSNPLFNFGDRQWGDTIDFVYTIKNTGDANLVLTQYYCSWAYTPPKPPTDTIAPGQTLELKVPLKLMALSFKRFPGTLEIVSNDPKTPRLAVQFTGTLHWPVKVEPQLLDFGDVEIAKGATLPITLTAPDDKTRFKITSVQSVPTPQIQTKIEEITPGKSYKVLVTVRPGTIPSVSMAGIHPRQGDVQIVTDNPAVGTITIPLQATIKSPIYVEPNGFFTGRKLPSRGTPAPLQPRSVSVHIRPHPDAPAPTPFKITAVEPPRPTITSEITPDGKGGYEVKLNNVLPTDDLNNLDVLIKTDLKDLPVLPVPIFFSYSP